MVKPRPKMVTLDFDFEDVGIESSEYATTDEASEEILCPICGENESNCLIGKYKISSLKTYDYIKDFSIEEEELIKRHDKIAPYKYIIPVYEELTDIGENYVIEMDGCNKESEDLYEDLYLGLVEATFNYLFSEYNNGEKKKKKIKKRFKNKKEVKIFKSILPPSNDEGFIEKDFTSSDFQKTIEEYMRLSNCVVFVDEVSSINYFEFKNIKDGKYKTFRDQECVVVTLDQFARKIVNKYNYDSNLYPFKNY